MAVTAEFSDYMTSKFDKLNREGFTSERTGKAGEIMTFSREWKGATVKVVFNMAEDTTVFERVVDGEKDLSFYIKGTMTVHYFDIFNDMLTKP